MESELETRDIIRRALREMDEEDMQLVEMLWRDFSNEEIGKRLGLQDGGVRSRKRRLQERFNRMKDW